MFRKMDIYVPVLLGSRKYVMESKFRIKKFRKADTDGSFFADFPSNSRCLDREEYEVVVE